LAVVFPNQSTFKRNGTELNVLATMACSYTDAVPVVKLYTNFCKSQVHYSSTKKHSRAQSQAERTIGFPQHKWFCRNSKFITIPEKLHKEYMTKMTTWGYYS
jgi:hypothetical protein